MTFAARVALVGAGALLYLGLAALGLGGAAAFLSHPPLIALALVFIALSIVALFAGGNVSPGVREDRGNRWVLPAIVAIGFADAYLPAWSDRRGIWTIDGDATRWLGVVLVFIGGLLRVLPVFQLGNRFSGLVAIQPGHTLAIDGFYRVIRHPSYLGLLIGGLGWGLAFRSGIGVLLALLLVPPVLARVASEEALLRSQFGAPYDAYRARTWRLIPGIYCLAAAVAIFGALFAVNARAAGHDAADALFAAGDFPAAAAAYQTRLAANPRDAGAQLNLGAIRLYQNDLAAAEPLVSGALTAEPTSQRATHMLAEIERRREEAARPSSVANGEAVVPFITADPLPVVRVLANGKPANFLVDTGAAVGLDPSFAAAAGVKTHSAGNGTFVGGKQAAMRAGMLDSLVLGGAEARDVPVGVMATHVLTLFPNVRIDGIVGTTYFERFLVTIDYPNRRLVLRPRTPQGSRDFQAAAASAGATIVPCYLVGDHFVFARAQVNSAPSGLFLFDSGMAGGGLMASQELLRAAGIVLDNAKAGTGIGGGGAVAVVPFVAGSITVGTAVQEGVRGLYTPEGSSFGLFPFTAWGIISNDFLAHYAYTVDFDAMRVVLVPAAPHS